MPRAGGCATATFPEEALDDPVFETVKGDDRETATGLQRALRGLKPLFQLVQLGVQVNPDRLEGACGRVTLLALAETRGAPDDRGELGGALEGASGDDGAGDRPGTRLLHSPAEPGR